MANDLVLAELSNNTRSPAIAKKKPLVRRCLD